ncbi:MAG TPA: hypothetical protein VGF74_12250 [Thermoleophilaceae bacterium]
MVEFVYKRRNSLRLAGLALLVAGLGIAIGISAVAGLVLIALAALILAAVQPLLMAHVRSRQARRRARNNGHGPGTGADDVDLGPL